MINTYRFINLPTLDSKKLTFILSFFEKEKENQNHFCLDVFNHPNCDSQLCSKHTSWCEPLSGSGDVFESASTGQQHFQSLRILVLLSLNLAHHSVHWNPASCFSTMGQVASICHHVGLRDVRSQPTQPYPWICVRRHVAVCRSENWFLFEPIDWRSDCFCKLHTCSTLVGIWKHFAQSASITVGLPPTACLTVVRLTDLCLHGFLDSSSGFGSIRCLECMRYRILHIFCAGPVRFDLRGGDSNGFARPVNEDCAVWM